VLEGPKRTATWAIVAVVGCATALVEPDVVAGDGRAPNGARAPDAGEEAETDDIALLDTPVPEAWLPAVRRCRRRGRRRFCDGPRRVPEPHGEAAELARRIEIGDRNTATRLLTRGPRPEWMEAVRGQARDTLQWPVDGGRIGRTVSRRRRGASHNGMDIPAPGGTKVRSVNDGLVVYSDNGVTGMGNLVIVLHADATATFYVHLRAAYLFAGEHVRRGQVIGELGTTGISQGNHLHFEWRRNGVPQDPTPVLVGIPLDRRGLPAFARPRPLRHAARFPGFAHLAD